MFLLSRSFFRSSFTPLLVVLLVGVQTSKADSVSWVERYALS